MSFPPNTPRPRLPDLTAPDDATELLGGWPADAVAAPAPVRLAWARRLFRRYERPPMRPGAI